MSHTSNLAFSTFFVTVVLVVHDVPACGIFLWLHSAGMKDWTHLVVQATQHIRHGTVPEIVRTRAQLRLDPFLLHSQLCGACETDYGRNDLE